MDLTDLAWPAVAALSKDARVVLPNATLELHGHHLPLFTGSLLLVEMAHSRETGLLRARSVESKSGVKLHP